MLFVLPLLAAPARPSHVAASTPISILHNKFPLEWRGVDDRLGLFGFTMLSPCDPTTHTRSRVALVLLAGPSCISQHSFGVTTCFATTTIPFRCVSQSSRNRTSQLHTAMLDNSVTWRLLKLSRKIVKKPISGTPSYRQQFVCFLLYIASHFETARRGIQLSAQWLTFHWENSDAGRWVSAVHLFYDWISQTWRRMSYPMS